MSLIDSSLVRPSSSLVRPSLAGSSSLYLHQAIIFKIIVYDLNNIMVASCGSFVNDEEVCSPSAEVKQFADVGLRIGVQLIHKSECGGMMNSLGLHDLTRINGYGMKFISQAVMEPGHLCVCKRTTRGLIAPLPYSGSVDILPGMSRLIGLPRFAWNSSRILPRMGRPLNGVCVCHNLLVFYLHRLGVSSRSFLAFHIELYSC